MSHRGADRLSEMIDAWLGDGRPAALTDVRAHLDDVARELLEAFPDVSDSVARERVRRRLAGFNPRTRSPQELLLDRAGDAAVRIARGVAGEDDYVPWPTVIGAAAVLVVAVAALSWLRRNSDGVTIQ